MHSHGFRDRAELWFPVPNNACTEKVGICLPRAPSQAELAVGFSQPGTEASLLALLPQDLEEDTTVYSPGHPEWKQCQPTLASDT